MTLEEMKVKAQYILDQKSGWKSCQDGSYEMALSYAGYYDLLKEIQALEKAQQESTIEGE